MHPHRQLYNNWQTSLAVLQLSTVTPSVDWVLFFWCCLTWATKESTLPLHRWSTQRSRGVVMRQAKGDNKARWCHQEFASDIKQGREEALSIVSVCFSTEIYLAPSGVTTVSCLYLAAGGQVKSGAAKPSFWSGSGAHLGDERCDTSPDPVLNGVFVCVRVWAPERGHLPPDWSWCVLIGCQALLGSRSV